MNRAAVIIIVIAVVAVGAAVLLTNRPDQPAAPGSGAGTTDRGASQAGGEPVDLSQLPTLTIAAAASPTDDPSTDGWDTEVLNNKSNKQLKALAHLFEDPSHITAEAVAPLLAEGATSDALAPDELSEVFTDGALTVRRPEAMPTTAARSDAAGVAAALAEVAAPFVDGDDIHVKFKLYTVTLDGETYLTQQYVAISAATDTGSVEQNATWRIRWTLPDGDGLPLIQHIALEDYELVEARTPSHMAFVEVTQAVLGGLDSYEPQLLRGMGHWDSRIQLALGVDPDGHNGIAIGDVNGDGREDVYLCQPGGLPNRLLLHQPDGTVRDASAETGVDILDRTRSALLVDVDNDGDADLVLVLERSIEFFANDGGGKFARVASVPIVRDMFSLAAADYDSDGNLDFFICAYQANPQDLVRMGTAPIPYHDANNGGRNVLLRSNGDWTFTDVTAETGLDENNTRWSFAAAWEDYDDDGHMDLYVANDYGRNNLYRNNGDGTFTDVAAEAGVEDISAGMGASWADYNNDGRMDLYVSNMFSSAGNRITYQRQFKTETARDTVAHFQRHARGNTLFENSGDGTFRDVSVQANVTMGRWAWGGRFVDVNNDGLEDIVVPNGFITNVLPDDL